MSRIIPSDGIVVVAKIGGNSGPSKEQEQLDSKRKITELVRMKFARFGDDALAIVLAYALQPVRMPMLLERLDLRVSAQDLPTRLDAVCQWIFDHGPIMFKMRALAERKAAKDAVEKTLPDFRPDVVLPSDTGARAAGATVAPSDTAARRANVTASPSDTAARSTVAGAPPASAPADTAARAAGAQAPVAVPSGPMINVPGYSGPERRSGTERRYKADRRAKLDATDRNKRFGGDRRKSPKGRRKEDQPKPDFWWRFIPHTD